MTSINVEITERRGSPGDYSYFGVTESRLDHVPAIGDMVEVEEWSTSNGRSPASYRVVDRCWVIADRSAVLVVVPCEGILDDSRGLLTQRPA